MDLSWTQVGLMIVSTEIGTGALLSGTADIGTAPESVSDFIPS